MLTRTTKDYRNEHPTDRRKDAERTSWKDRIFRLVECPEKGVHDCSGRKILECKDSRHLLRDALDVTD